MISIAVDGIASSGKSTVSQALAKRLEFGCFNTGEVYRAVTRLCLDSGLLPNSPEKIVSLLKKIKLSISFEGIKQQIFVNGSPLETDYKATDINNNVAHYSKLPEVRKYVIELQRQQATISNIVMEGRDIGTVVLPNASFKFFLGADSSVRAKRRVLELQSKNTPCTYDEIIISQFERDMEDILRGHSPLYVPVDSYYINTSDRTIEETVEYMMNIITNK